MRYQTMLKISGLVLVLGLALAQCVVAGTPLGPESRIEITEIKNVGVSATNEANSIIQVSWNTESAPDIKIQGYELNLEVTYSDGNVARINARATASAQSTRFEVPTSHRGQSRAPAEMKNLKVSITAAFSATASKQVAF